VREVTEMAEVAPHTVSRFETEQGELRHDTATKLKAAFAEPGVKFITDADPRACICYQPLNPEAGDA
jgi:predicted transcriptional regulator